LIFNATILDGSAENETRAKVALSIVNKELTNRGEL
jgi:hypothetical protein